ncbi:MAG: hypothetical protein IJ661_07580 [Lachnospiraceae bacterium]|nr:hypothetical protein [Lachnospiraceae bacterium]
MSKKKKKKRAGVRTENRASERELEKKDIKKEMVITVVVLVCAFIAIAIGLVALFHMEHTAYDTVVFKVGDEKVRKDEINFLMLQNAVDLGISEDKLNITLGQYISLDADSADEYYKNEIAKMIMDYKVECLIAKKQGISLSKDEEDAARKDATRYLSIINARVLNEIGVTRDRVIDIYEQRSLANKLLEETKKEIHVEDEDIDKRFASVYIMLFPKVETTDDGDYVREEDGETPIMLSDEEINKQKENAYSAYKELTEEGADIEELARKYNIEAFSGMEYNLVDSFADPFLDYIKKLKEGEYSEVIEESSFYGIVKMVSENNEEISNQIMKQYNEDMVKEELEKRLDGWYEELGISKDPVFVGSAWDKITFYDFTKYVSAGDAEQTGLPKQEESMGGADGTNTESEISTSDETD